MFHPINRKKILIGNKIMWYLNMCWSSNKPDDRNFHLDSMVHWPNCHFCLRHAHGWDWLPSRWNSWWVYLSPKLISLGAAQRFLFALPELMRYPALFYLTFSHPLQEFFPQGLAYTFVSVIWQNPTLSVLLQKSNFGNILFCDGLWRIHRVLSTHHATYPWSLYWHVPFVRPSSVMFQNWTHAFL